MNVLSHAAKLGNVAQTKAELLAQSQLLKAQQFGVNSANVGGMMRGMGSGGMQLPQMSMMGMMGNGGINPFNQGMLVNQIDGCGGLGKVCVAHIFIYDDAKVLNL